MTQQVKEGDMYSVYKWVSWGGEREVWVEQGTVESGNPKITYAEEKLTQDRFSGEAMRYWHKGTGQARGL